MAAVGALSNMRVSSVLNLGLEADDLQHSRRGDVSPLSQMRIKLIRIQSCLAAFCAVSGLLDLLSDVPLEIMSQMNEYKRNIYRGQRLVEHKTEPKDKWEFWKETPGHHVSYLEG